MTKFNSIFLTLTIIALLSSLSKPINAEEITQPIPDHRGYAYVGTRSASSISPTVVLTTVALAAIIAVLVSHGSSNKYSHGHSHSH